MHQVNLAKRVAQRLLGTHSPPYLYLYHRVYRRPRFPSVADVVHRFAQRHAHREVTFAQIGANEGATEDVLYYPILRYGWRGVLVEPQAEEFAKLRDNYAANPKLAFENAAVVADASDAPHLHYVVKDPGIPAWVSKLSSFDPRIPRQVLEHYPGARIASRAVAALSFDELLARHGLLDLDVLLVDTEGYDFEILKLVDWSRTRPALVVYEHRHLSPHDALACESLLERQGYLLHGDDIDTVAIGDPEIRRAYARVAG